MIALAAAAHIKGPHIDLAALSPFVVLAGGALLVLLIGLLRSPVARERVVPGVTVFALLASIGLEVWRFRHHAQIVSSALAVDDLALVLDFIFSAAAIASVVMSWRAPAPHEAGHGEYHSLLLFSVLGMAIFVSAQNLITLFLGIELLSIPLYVLCASESRRERSLESGLKYLVIGSVGSATLAYGLALIYGATGATDFSAISDAVSQSGGVVSDPLLLTGIGLAVAGFAFKASIAPFHQWTPDVYEGASTPITAFMATATKAAAFGVFLRFFDVAVVGTQNDWAPLLAALATITIIVGNAGALGQSSIKRMLAYSSVAQAGYMLGGVVVGTQLGIEATVFYLLGYLAMNLAAFTVIVARERESADGDDIAALAGLGARRPALAVSMTVAMLALAGIPATVGFIGKFYLIRALVDGDYTWLGVVIVVGSMLSLGYYLRLVATIWMGPASDEVPAPARTVSPGGLPAIAGGSSEADALELEATGGPPELVLVAVVSSAACVFFGIFPSPLFDLVSHAGHAIGGIF